MRMGKGICWISGYKTDLDTPDEFYIYIYIEAISNSIASANLRDTVHLPGPAGAAKLSDTKKTERKIPVPGIFLKMPSLRIFQIIQSLHVKAKLSNQGSFQELHCRLSRGASRMKLLVLFPCPDKALKQCLS